MRAFRMTEAARCAIVSVLHNTMISAADINARTDFDRRGIKSGTRWDRCKPECGCTDPNEGKRDIHCDCRSNKCERDSYSDAARRRYALKVTENLTGPRDGNGYLVCPLTGNLFHVTTGEVDRCVPALGYIPGNIVLVSRAGNQERGKLQQHFADLLGASRYAEDVVEASDYIDIPSGTVAKNTRHEIAFDIERAKREDVPSEIMLNVLRGEYGIA